MFNSINHLRQILGCTQDELAAYLEISRSSMAMAETQKRPTVESASPHMNHLAYCLSQPLPPGNLAEQFEFAEEHQFGSDLLKRLSRLQRDLTRFTHQLVRAQKGYDKAIVVLRHLSKITIISEGESRHRQERSLSVFRSRQIGLLEKYGKSAQYDLQLKIAAIRVQIEMITASLAQAA